MSDFIKIQNQLSGIIISGEKNNRISEEDCITPPISKMILSYVMSSASGHNELCFFDANRKTDMTLTLTGQIATGVRRVKFYIYPEDFDTNRLHLLALHGPDCSPNGVIHWADDQLTITPGILNKKFSVTLTERSLPSARTAWGNAVDLLARDGHAGLVQLQEPVLPMMPWLRARVVCLYQNDTPGDVTWHKLESTTDAFQYLPPKPRVVSARSLRLDDPEDADTGTSRVTLTLNRPLIQGRDKLHNATLGNAILPHQYRHGENRVDVDLRDWLHDPEGKEDVGRLLSARIQLNGSTGSRAWTGVGADVKILLPLPPRPRPPTLEDRRRREFSEDEVESEYGGME